MSFYAESSSSNNDLNFFKKTNGSMTNRSSTPLVNHKLNSSSNSPVKKSDQPVMTSRSSLSNIPLDQIATSRVDNSKFQTAQRVLDSQREKISQLNKPVTSNKIDLSLNFNKTNSSSLIKTSLSNYSKNQPTAVLASASVFNISNNLNNKKYEETKVKDKSDLKSSFTGERVLVKIDTAREGSSRKEEVIREIAKVTTRVFEEIKEDPSAKKVDDKSKIITNILNNNLVSDEEFRSFLMNPIPQGLTLMCNLIRKKTGFDKLTPKYFLYTEKNNKFLLSAKKRSGNTTSNYIISVDEEDFEKSSTNTIGKLRSNFMGTEFNIFDKGLKPSESKSFVEVRQQYGAILYESNLFGMNGPRKMKVYIPDPKDTYECKPLRPLGEGEWLQNQATTNKKASIRSFCNKAPVWSEKLKTYTLSFKGRVEKASVKNFQLIDDGENSDQDKIYLQFGRLADDKFSLDFQWPFSPYQAFTVALSSLDNKLGCE